MDSGTRSQMLEKVICASFRTNAPRKGMNLSDLNPAMCKLKGILDSLQLA